MNNSLKKYITLPNMLTSLRILGAVILLFIQPLSAAFFVIYTLSGVSDAVDGTVARATHTSGEFGARLDSIADLLFYAVMLIKVFPVLWVKLPKSIWYFVLGIIVIRLCSYLTAFIKYKLFASLHTYLNKLTGLMLFMVPYVLMFNFTVEYCIAVAAVAGIGTVEEFIMHVFGKTYIPDRKTIFCLNKSSEI